MVGRVDAAIPGGSLLHEVRDTESNILNIASLKALIV